MTFGVRSPTRQRLSASFPGAHSVPRSALRMAKLCPERKASRTRPAIWELGPVRKFTELLMSHQEPEAFSTTMISWNDNASGLPVQAP